MRLSPVPPLDVSPARLADSLAVRATDSCIPFGKWMPFGAVGKTEEPSCGSRRRAPPKVISGLCDHLKVNPVHTTPDVADVIGNSTRGNLRSGEEHDQSVSPEEDSINRKVAVAVLALPGCPEMAPSGNPRGLVDFVGEAPFVGSKPSYLRRRELQCFRHWSSSGGGGRACSPPPNPTTSNEALRTVTVYKRTKLS